MNFSVIGSSNQCAVAQMTYGDEIHAEVGAMVLLSDGVALEAAVNSSTARASDLPMMSQSVPLTLVRCMAELGVVAFAARCTGELRHLEVHRSGWLCARASFLFCSRDVSTTYGFVHRVEDGYFRDGGYVLYRLGGHGEAYIHCGGNVIEYDLVEGQRVSVDAGCVAAYQDTVQSTVEAFEGLPSTHGGTESLFLVTLTGPGRIYLATLPLSRIARAVRGERLGTVQMAASGTSTLSGLVKEP